ncbi:hypothetical protein P389DRAFT_42160 [Cystobasidium minutum MCA 4210]|uniref:uncharacterized protein n=1 Tax=Cystobasidium minutum MCA 4210 TaxID=1397322 RepID=UPI0034CF1711|eukprot:jgi/Rhomi1/42160/CE42159_128
MTSSLKHKLDLLKNDPLLSASELPSHSAVPSPTPAVHTQNASSLLKNTRKAPRLSSGSASFDSLIVSSDSDQIKGLSPGQLLELSGCPGEGKTRACISYAIQACLDGDDADTALRVLILDTQGCFALTALLRAALAACDGDEGKAMLCLDRMAIWECYESDDLPIALHSLKAFTEVNTSLKLVIIDSLSAHLNANLVPGHAAQLQADYERSNSKYQNGNNNNGSSNKRQRKGYFANDPKLDASFNIIRNIMTGLLKDTLMAVISTNIAVIATTQSKTKLMDEFGEPAGVRDAKHSFAVPQFFNHWHIPLSTQIILAAAADDSRTAMTVMTPSSIRGLSTTFRTSESGIADV